MKSFFSILILVFLISGGLAAQPVPAEDENIPYLMTFGGGGLRETSWGDDDFCQIFFFAVPESFTDPIYIRIYDPDIGGEVDEINDVWDTRVTYSVYGGSGSYSEEDARETEPAGRYKSGNLLATKTFGFDMQYEKNWYTFGPFNPTEGEYDEKYGNIFKIITEGVGGNDGNLYRFFLSSSPDENIRIEGANAFTYEYTFRMWNDPEQVSHIYPYIDDRTISVKQSNFDWDDDGFIRVVSVARNGQLQKISGEDDWAESEFVIRDEELNSSLDFEFVKRKSPYVVRNNNVVISVRNQYGELLPFFTIPIGGVPKYKYNIGVKPKNK
ncbi:MAG: hypothetical protein AMS23_10845 [Bacteroides sp. SM1_62]|nr:MAG: hypothetical protein AMS23_10845 [Bacteroides sp. SM1_62]